MNFRDEFEKSYCKLFMASEKHEEALNSVKSLRNGDTYDNEALAGHWMQAKDMQKTFRLWMNWGGE